MLGQSFLWVYNKHYSNYLRRVFLSIFLFISLEMKTKGVELKPRNQTKNKHLNKKVHFKIDFSYFLSD